MVLQRWAEERQVCFNSPRFARAEPGTPPDQLPDWARFLLRFAVAFRQRSLRFLVQRLNQIYGKLDDPEQRGLQAARLDGLKRKIYDAAGETGRLHNGTRMGLDDARWVERRVRKEG